MNKIIVVTKCLKTSTGRPGSAHFSFHGFYAGYKVKSLLIYHESFTWEEDDEYIIYLSVIQISKNCLEGKALKIKKLSEFMMGY